MQHEAYTTKGKMEQRERHQEQRNRAAALHTAATLMTSNNGWALDVIQRVGETQNAARKLELLTNHLLTFIETGQFLEHGN